MNGRFQPSKSVVRAILCLTLVVLIPASAGLASGPAGRGVAPTVVNVAVLPIEPTAQAFYAKHRGFFLKQGIDARITVLSDPAQILAAVLSGDAQFSSFSTGGLATLRSRGAPIRLVAAGALYRPKAPTTALLAAPGKKIIRARDLVGKLVAIDAPNTLAHIGLLKWLKRNGVSAEDVRFVQIPFAQMLGPLGRGTVDAAVLPEPFPNACDASGVGPFRPHSPSCLFAGLPSDDLAWLGGTSTPTSRLGSGTQSRKRLSGRSRKQEPAREPRDSRQVRANRLRPDQKDDANLLLDAAQAGARPTLDRRLCGVRGDPGVVLGDRPGE